MQTTTRDYVNYCIAHGTKRPDGFMDIDNSVSECLMKPMDKTKPLTVMVMLGLDVMQWDLGRNEPIGPVN